MLLDKTGFETNKIYEDKSGHSQNIKRTIHWEAVETHQPPCTKQYHFKTDIVKTEDMLRKDP